MKGTRCDGKETHLLEPGEWKRDDDGSVYFVTPNGHLGHTRVGTWSHEWHEDGTVTIQPSLRLSGGREGNQTLWHGYLTKGVFESCNDF